MQSIQPELNKIQAKYAGRNDDRSKMLQAQEMQALYKKNHVKEKKYAQPKQSGMAGSMNMMMYMSTGMIAIFAINWPLAMSFYWLVGSVVRVLQNILVHKFFIKD